MPARPPVGSGLYTPVLTVAESPFWKLARPLAIAWSVLVQVALVIQRASNRARAESMLDPRMAGSRARTRTASLPATDVPLNATRLSLTTPGKSGLWLPMAPLSRDMAIASESGRYRGGRFRSRTVMGGPVLPGAGMSDWCGSLSRFGGTVAGLY